MDVWIVVQKLFCLNENVHWLDGNTFFFLMQVTQTHRDHRYATWTLKTREGKYLSVNEQNELILGDQPTVFTVMFIGRNRQFVKLYIPGKGYVKVMFTG